MTCRYCHLPVEHSVRTLAYWNQTPDVCHPECRAAGERQEAIDCQTIDADCNNCRHYQRGKIAPKQISKVKTQDGRIVDVIYKPEIFIDGQCLKFNKPVLACPNKWSGLECFEHREVIC